jgi:hypothetical protein
MLFGTRDAVEGQQDITPVSPVQETAALPDIACYADPEIQIVAGRYGELVAGKEIQTTLTELQEILPRPRKRADAYQSLSRRLAAMGVTLVIKREVRHGK